MANEVNKDGASFRPADLTVDLVLTQEQLEQFKRISPPTIDYGYLAREHQKRMKRLVEEIQESVEDGKEDFIQRSAAAYAKAQVETMQSSPFLLDEIIGVLADLCGNRHYNTSSDEDTMNDYVRDMLGRNMQVRDQTRQGHSANSRTAEAGNAGEVDIQIRQNGRPIGIYERLRLDSVVELTIHKHIAKATVNYNPQGVKEVFVVAYTIKHATGFGDFWNRFSICVKKYEAENDDHSIIWDDEETETGLSAVRAIHGTFQTDSSEHNIHVIAVKIQE